MITEYAVRSYFALAQSRGWYLLEGSLAQGWRAKFEGRLNDYDVYLTADEDWVYMQCPLYKAEVRVDCRAGLYAYLLCACDRMFMAKFTLVPVGKDVGTLRWVALTTECPLDSFDANMFRVMTEALATYAEQYDREITVLAREPTVVSKTGAEA